MRYKNILIYCKRGPTAAYDLGRQISTWLAQCGVSSEFHRRGDAFRGSDFDCAIVLGGDGTLIGLARELAGSGIPLFSINFGRLGFLTTAEAGVWREALSAALDGNLEPRQYLILEWQIWRGESLIDRGAAINDVVVSRNYMARLVSLNVKINNEDLGLLRGDGVIVCSPIGSSGYNLSAGGAALYPSLNVIGLTPVCPFMMNAASMVFPGDAVFEFRIEPGSANCYLTIDGQEGTNLEINDIARVTGRQNGMRIFILDELYFERLRRRCFSPENPAAF